MQGGRVGLLHDVLVSFVRIIRARTIMVANKRRGVLERLAYLQARLAFSS